MSDGLLSLPGELRNIIYQFVLYEENGLDYVEVSPGLGWLCLQKLRRRVDNSEHRVARGRTVANQLQLVCRQLRCETKTLSIRYNAINFPGQDPAMISKFLNSVPFSLHGAIKVLNISPIDDTKAPAFSSDVIKFFRNRPQCILRFYHPTISSKMAHYLIITAFMIKYRVRRDKTFVYKIFHAANTQKRLFRTLRMKGVLDALAPMPLNIVFYPSDKIFYEGEFRNACHRETITRVTLIPTLTNGVDDLVAVAKDLYENGV